MVPSAGAYKAPMVGSMAMPFPNAPEEKTWSLTSAKGTTLPSNGLLRITRSLDELSVGAAGSFAGAALASVAG